MRRTHANSPPETVLKENVGWPKVDKPRCPSRLGHGLEHHAHVKALLGRLMFSKRRANFHNMVPLKLRQSCATACSLQSLGRSDGLRDLRSATVCRPIYNLADPVFLNDGLSLTCVCTTPTCMQNDPRKSPILPWSLSLLLLLLLLVYCRHVIHGQTVSIHVSALNTHNGSKRREGRTR